MKRRALGARPCGIVTLLSDFGTKDSYVSEMKGALLSRDPSLRLVDITHEVPPQDVAAGAFQLACAAPSFPPGTVHLAVVDPGVGGRRAPVAIRTRRAYYVGPENGLLDAAAQRDGIVEARELSPRSLGVRELSRTFHGRDLFAPAAAWIAAGRSFAGLGPRCVPRSAAPETSATSGRARVVSIDRFGNVVLSAVAGSIPRPRALLVTIRGKRHLVPWVEAYDGAARGALLAIEGSHGFLELSVRDGRAADRLRLAVGDWVRFVAAVDR